jgi:outer membrane protein
MRKFITGVMLLCTGFQLQAQVAYSLADCRKMATTHSKEVKIAAEKVNAAESLRKAARTQYLPSVSANGGYMHNQKNISLLGEDQYLPVFAYNADGSVNYAASWNNNWTSYLGQVVPTDINGTPFNPVNSPDKIQWKYKAFIPKDAFEFDTKNVFVGAVTVTQPLFLGGKILQLNRLADSNKKLAEAQQEGEVAQIIVDTDVAYWRIVSLESKETLAQGYMDLLKKLESDIDKAIAIGVATKSDGLTIKVRLNEAEMSLMQAQDGLSLSRMALCQVCGLPLESEFRLEDEHQEILHETVETTPLTGASVYDRYEVKGLIQAVNMAESAEKIAVSRFLPNAALTAGYIVSNPTMYNGFENEFGGQYQVGVVVNVPLFHFGERVHTLRSAKSEKTIAQYKLEEAQEKIELDIAQARFKNNESLKKAQMAAFNKKKAEENLHYANVGFEAGTITASTLMEAQTAWLKASSEDIDARIDVQLTRVQLQKALGNLY